MMHKAWSGIEELPYCIPWWSVKFQGHAGMKKSPILTRIERFRTVTLVWILRWIWNDAQSWVYYKRGALIFVDFKVTRAEKSKNRFESNLRPLDITRPVAAIKSLWVALFGLTNKWRRRVGGNFLKYMDIALAAVARYLLYTSSVCRPDLGLFGLRSLISSSQIIWITFIFNRCHPSWAAATHLKKCVIFDSMGGV